MSPLRNAFWAQIVGVLTAAAAIKIVSPQLFSQPLICAVLQGAIAAVTSYKLAAARWWTPIHLGFLPLAVIANQLGIPPFVWLGAFLLFFLLFWRTDKSQVPLFLTNARAAQEIAGLLPDKPLSFLDLGCGTGSLIRFLAKARPDCRFTGIEHAPLPYLLAKTRNLYQPNVTIRYGNFWGENLGLYQVVYAFLSPVPMTKLWQKSCAEMTTGALLISNSFDIHDVASHAVVEVPDRRSTRLYCYHPTADKNQLHDKC